jgi:hypothetical protein
MSFRSLLVIAALVVTLAQSLVAGSEGEAPRCARCGAAIVDQLKVVVTDFASRRECPCCNVACALSMMIERFPTSRAVARDPFAGKEVRIIRTGAKWVAWPKSAVFLYLPQAQALAPPLRCLAFPCQVEYIQYLATHPEVAAFKPRPLRLPELRQAIKEQTPKERPAQ